MSLAFDHRIQDLHLHGNVILEHQRPYMTATQLQVVGRGKVREGEDNLVSYQFILNDLADNVWAELFRQQVTAIKELSAGIHAKAIILNCAETDLPEKYALLKAVIEKTNGSYAQEKQALLAFLQEKDAKKKEAEAKAANRLDQLQKGFNDLKL